MIRVPGPRVRAVHIAVLAAFAVGQPLFDLMASNGEFLVAHRADSGDALWLALGIGLGVPGLVAVATWGLERALPPLSVALHLGTLALLTAAIGLPVLKRFVDVPGVLLVPAALGIGGVTAAAYARLPRVRVFFTVLAIAVVIFPASFLTSDPVSELSATETPIPALDPGIEADTDVVIVVFDALPLNSLLDEAGRIDADRHSNFATLARESHWFRNATTVAEETTFALPAILTGMYPRWKLLPLARTYPQSLFTLLAASHELHVLEPVTQLCPRALCATPQTGGGRVERLGEIGSDLFWVYLHVLAPADWARALPSVSSTWTSFGRSSGAQDADEPTPPHGADVTAAFAAFLEGVRDRGRPALHFLHLDLPHGPYTHLPSGKSYGGRGRLRKGSAEMSGDLEWATTQALQRHLFQLAYADTLLGRLRRRLESEDLWDRSLVIVTSDHGRSFRPGSDIRRISAGNEGVADILLVPLFVKLPGQREGSASDRNVETIDILPTVIDVLGGEPPSPLDGRSLLDTTQPERPRKVAYGSHRSAAGRRKPMRRKVVFAPSLPSHEEMVRRIYATFDFSAGRDGLFRVGPHRELVGERTRELRIGADSAFSVRLDDPQRYGDVDPDSKVVPAQVKGSLDALEIPNEPLDLAVAVNGTIYAVTRSHGHQKRLIRFEAMVPERAFRKGPNRVEIFVVTEGDGGLELRPAAPAASGAARGSRSQARRQSLPSVAAARVAPWAAARNRVMQLPKQGTPRDDVIARMRERKAADADWRGGRTWSLIYPAGEDVDAMLRDAHDLYLYENALNPFRFPSLRQMEDDVVSMTAGLLHADDEAGGAMTSGGTESILMAVKAARDRGRAERGIDRPEMVVPYSAHPAFAKAAKYLGLELKAVPLDDDYRADVSAAAELVGENTALVVGSAPNYPFGVVDPIPELAALAADRGASFHTDSCLGGFLLPFLERLGERVPPFDFRVPGVTTMSADVHKYGYCTKGASVIVHRDRAHLHQYQLFVYDAWPGGLYGSFAMAGARPAAPIAASWAVMQFLGEEGYVKLASSLRDTTRKLREGIEAIPALRVWGDPIMSVMSFGSESIDIAAVGDAMDDRGWHLDRQTNPAALHLMVSPAHAQIADEFLADLRDAVAHHGDSRGKQARYS